ncbi:MAG TPA: hypothetical protein VF122_03365, partial [Caulobacteraceae bacterium]
APALVPTAVLAPFSVAVAPSVVFGHDRSSGRKGVVSPGVPQPDAPTITGAAQFLFVKGALALSP